MQVPKENKQKAETNILSDIKATMVNVQICAAGLHDHYAGSGTYAVVGISGIVVAVDDTTDTEPDSNKKFHVGDDVIGLLMKN